MDATLMLADHAEALNGKLYINGGGWTNLWAPDMPVNFSLAIILHVPWDQANTKHDLLIELLDGNGDRFEFNGQSVVIPQQFEVGRPPGTKPGSSLDTPISWTFNGLQLPADGYEFKLSIDGEPIASRPFVVAARPQG